MSNAVVKAPKDYIPQMYEQHAASVRGFAMSSHIKTLRMFGVTGITNANDFQRVKNFLLEIACPISYSEKKGLIWVREIGETLDRLFSGLSKFS